MEWVASTLTLPRNMGYPALLPLMRTPRLPVVDRTDALADLNGLARFAERRNLVSARVPSHFTRSLLRYSNLQVKTSRVHIYHARGRMALIPEFGSFHRMPMSCR